MKTLGFEECVSELPNGNASPRHSESGNVRICDDEEGRA